MSSSLKNTSLISITLDDLEQNLIIETMLTKTLIKYSSLFLRDIDKNDIWIFLESFPFYPNLLSVLQTLQYVGLDVHAGQCDLEYLSNLKSPFLRGSGRIQNLSYKSGTNPQNLKVKEMCQDNDRQIECVNILGFP